MSKRKNKEKKRNLESREREDEVKAFFKKERPFDQIDMNLFYYRKLKMAKKSFSVVKNIPIGILIVQTIAFIIFIIRSEETTADEKMIFFGGFVIVVTITMPIIQYLYKRDDVLSNDKIEYHLLFQNQLLLRHLDMSSEEKKDAEEVLRKIRSLDSIETIDEKDFLHIRYDKELSRLANIEK